MSKGAQHKHAAFPVAVPALITLAAGLALALFLVRFFGSVSFAEPLQSITSGDEMSSIFAVWKALNGEEVYADRFRAPYALALFNWLFYVSNAAWSGAWMQVFGLGDEWIPTLTRLWTVAGCLTGAIAGYLLFRTAARQAGHTGIVLPAALAVLLGFGPLYGFWAITARPDVWAVSLEILSVGAFLWLYRKNAFGAVLAGAVIAYLSWSFKQTSVFGLGGIGLFLLIRRDFRALTLLTGVSVALWSAPLVLLGRVYVETVFVIGFPLEYSAERMLRNLMNGGAKTLYIWLPLVAVLVALYRRGDFRGLLNEDITALAICGLVLSLPMSVLMLMQTASSENYLFTPAFFGTLALAAILPRAFDADDSASRVTAGASAAGSALTSLVVLAVLFGFAGLTRPQGSEALLSVRKECIDVLPRPLFVEHRTLSLPWLTTNNVPYVLSYLYERERALGRTFEHGGIGGMLDAGAFEAIVHPHPMPPDHIDGADLGRYSKLPDTCGDMAIFIKSDRDDIESIAAKLIEVER